MSSERPAPEGTLRDRFAPDTGAVLPVGRVWPARLVVHGIVQKTPAAGSARLTPSLWIRHPLPQDVDVRVEPVGGLVTDRGELAEGVEGFRVGSAEGRVAPSTDRRMSLSVQWDRGFAQGIRRVRWVRQALALTLTDGADARLFRWHLYLTPSPPELGSPGPVFTWMAHPGAEPWLELPGAAVPVAWVRSGREGSGPQDVELDVGYPEEPAPEGADPVDAQGVLGGAARPPRVFARPVEVSALAYWDSPRTGPSGVREWAGPIPGAGQPEVCLWPNLRVAGGGGTVVVYDLGRRVPCRVSVAVVLDPSTEAVDLHAGALWQGSETIGHWEWEGPPRRLAPGARCTLRLQVQPDRLVPRPQPQSQAGAGRPASLEDLALRLQGRPRRGQQGPPETLWVPLGDTVVLDRRGPTVDDPWLAVEVGATSTAVALAWREGARELARLVVFDDGPTLPSTVALERLVGGETVLASRVWSEEATRRLGVVAGLAEPEAPHPDAPDPVAGVHVAHHFLRAVFRELAPRAAWFPLDRCRLVLAVPPDWRGTAAEDVLRSGVAAAVAEALGRDVHDQLWLVPSSMALVVPRLLATPPEGPRAWWVPDRTTGTGHAVVVRRGADGIPRLADGGADRDRLAADGFQVTVLADPIPQALVDDGRLDPQVDLASIGALGAGLLAVGRGLSAPPFEIESA